MQLKDKVAIVTGAGQGIGAAFARELASAEAKVVIADVNEDMARAVATSLTAEGYDAMALKTDVSDERNTRAMARDVAEQYGRIDILINNAAIFSTIETKPIEDITVEEWDRLMGVNLRGVFLCSKAVIPYMKSQKKGKIINISSATVFMGKPYYIHYVTSKAGVIGFTRALAREVGEFNINVNCITPGYTRTEIPRGTTTAEQLKGIVNHQCIKRIGEPQDLVGAMIFLASDHSDFMSGQIVNVDGGDNLH
jgi:3-oxoacyl-[acyl-carrier protein] reductase